MANEPATIPVSDSLRTAWREFDSQYPEDLPTVTRESAEQLYFELAKSLAVGTHPLTQRENDIIIAETVVAEIRSGQLSFNSLADAAAEVAQRIRQQ